MKPVTSLQKEAPEYSCQQQSWVQRCSQFSLKSESEFCQDANFQGSQAKAQIAALELVRSRIQTKTAPLKDDKRSARPDLHCDRRYFWSQDQNWLVRSLCRGQHCKMRLSKVSEVMLCDVEKHVCHKLFCALKHLDTTAKEGKIPLRCVDASTPSSKIRGRQHVFRENYDSEIRTP